jgi:molybdopterin-binding protein
VRLLQAGAGAVSAEFIVGWNVRNPALKVKNMKISARNVLDGTVKEVKKGTTTSHVLIDIKGLNVTASITNEAVDELGLKPGLKVQAVVKSSDVMVAVA